MADLNPFYVKWTPRLLSVLRIAVALLFIEHGSEKLFGFPTTQQAASGSLPPLILVAGVLEFFGGLLILFGLFTRPVAFVLSGEMAVAYFMSHAPQGFFPLQNRGELAALYSFVFLFFAVAGGGAWSLDNLLWRRSATSPRSRAA
ncbi:MAG: DoxX family protein [Pyrinomonadaceae bacterium]|nr:DoxX family protein [Pyrinomonadaceae bacterium]